LWLTLETFAAGPFLGKVTALKTERPGAIEIGFKHTALSHFAVARVHIKRAVTIIVTLVYLITLFRRVDTRKTAIRAVTYDRWILEIRARLTARVIADSIATTLKTIRALLAVITLNQTSSITLAELVARTRSTIEAEVHRIIIRAIGSADAVVSTLVAAWALAPIVTAK